MVQEARSSPLDRCGSGTNINWGAITHCTNNREIPSYELVLIPIFGEDHWPLGFIVRIPSTLALTCNASFRVQS